MNKRPIAIDFFCGAGGLSLGFEQAGFDIVLGVDRDPYHCSAHERNFPYGKTLCASVTDLTGEFIKKYCSLDQEVDVIIGGPPCQGFSMMGKRNLDDPRSSLVAEFVRLIKEIRPKAFVMENVPGMMLGKTKPYFDFVIESFTELGYVIQYPVKTLVASDYGAPQKRERLFILGVRKDINQTAPNYPVGPIKGQVYAHNVGDAFDGLPSIKNIQELYDNDFLKINEYLTPTSNYSKVMMGFAKDATDLSYPRTCKDDVIFGFKRTKHSQSSIDLYEHTQPGSVVPGHKLPKLSFEGLSPTLRAGSESERGSHTAPRPIHPEDPRCITVREAARLHGYPDWFAFYPVVHHGFRQVGNSVSPLVARNVGYQILEVLGLNATAIKPKAKIELSNKFTLIEDRKKSEKRISHLDEFPKVINYLFEQAYDKASGKLLHPDFSFSDIEKAFLITQAKTPRIQPDSFLSEFSKTRNAKAIIAMPLSHGFSIVATSTGGRFVDSDTQGAIGFATTVGFSSKDVKSAIDDNSMSSSADILKTEFIFRQFGKLTLVGELFESDNLNYLNYWSSKKKTNVLVWRNGLKSIPFEKIQRLAVNNNVDNIISISSLTSAHHGVVVFQVVGNKVKAQAKEVYLIT